MDIPLPLADRATAGTLLAERLAPYQKAPETLVLALVRGGLPVAAEIAKKLHLPLYPYIVRKIGHPAHREFAVGALAEGGSSYYDEQVARGLDPSELEAVEKEEHLELQRRKQVYSVKPRPDMEGKRVILVDDGAATGATLLAAIKDLRGSGVSEIILTLPVCAPDTAARLSKEVDGTKFLATPSPFSAVGVWYRHFPQLEDNEAIRLLEDT